MCHDPILRPEMDKAIIRKSSIAIINCQVKKKTEFNSGSDSTSKFLLLVDQSGRLPHASLIYHKILK